MGLPGADVENSQFGFSAVTNRGKAIVSLSGEFDVLAATNFEERALEVAHLPEVDDKVLTIDLSEVSFINSRALKSMLALQETLAGQDRAVALREPSTPVMRILEMTELVDTFPIVDDAGQQLN